MTEIKLSTEDHDIDDLLRYLDGDHHMSVFDRQQVVKAIKAQLPKPAIEEPKDFGSIVRAFVCGSNAELWVRVRVGQLSEWANEHGSHVAWRRLCEPEVLRVGVGEGDYAQGVQDTAERMRKQLVHLASSAVTAPEKRCYQTAEAMVAALLGES